MHGVKVPVVENGLVLSGVEVAETTTPHSQHHDIRIFFRHKKQVLRGIPFSLIFVRPPIENKMKGYMYILECANGKYYVGSAQDLKARIRQHQDGEGANFTWKNLPVRLVYFEEYDRIDDAYLREKQVQGWSRKKKEALIYGDKSSLHDFSKCKNDTHFKNKPPES